MKTKKILAVFLITMTLFSVLTVSALSLSWDGSSAGGSTNAVNGSNKGYVIRSTNDDACVVGYRFSVVNNSGDMKVNKVIDVFRKTTNGNNAYSTSAKFSTKYNKKQLIANMNARLETTNNTTNCYKESAMNFVTALPNPSGVKTWQAYETNINKVLSKIGVGSVSNMYYGDKVIIEPLFDVCLAGEYQALTVTEIAYCGRSVLGGSSTGGTSNGTSSTWGFIANYTNRIWPNKLFTPDGQGLWTAASTIGSSSKASFNTLLNYGYGAGIAYSETQNLSYTIKFNGNGATSGSTASMSMSYGTAKNLTANGFKKTGNVFTGWNTKADGSGTKYTDKQSVKNLTTTNGATVNLYAQWKAYVLTICYDCYGSSPTFTESKGFSFGNYNRILTTGSSRKTIAGTDNVYYNAYNYNNEIGGYGLHDFSTFGLTAPTGYKFKCWDNAGKSYDETTTTYKPTDFTSDIVNGDTHVWMTAKFSPISYSVKFNGNGATSGSMSNQSFTYDTSKALTANAFKREFTVTYNYNYSGKANTTAKASATFNGWAKTSSGSVTYTNKQTVKNLSSVDGDVVNIYAKWTDASVTLPTPTRTGYSFSGWYTASSGGTKIGSGGSSYKPTGNITVYAHWSASSYTVTYNANGGSGAPSAQTKTHGVDLTLSSTKPTRTGYYFKNWNTASNGSGTNYASGAKYTQNYSLTLYAQWTPHTYTVTYKANGGSGEPAAQTKTYGVDLTLSSAKPSRTGYTFKNWNTNSGGSGTTYASGGKYTANASVTLYAQWTPITYTIIFNGNGYTSGSTASMTMTYDTAKNLTANGFVKTSYVFTGWNTKSNGSGTSYANKQSVKNLTTVNGATITLYAQWTANPYTVIFNGNRSTSGTTASQVIATDATASLNANGYIRTGYSFVKWNTKTDGSGTSYQDKATVKNLAPGGSSITLYAQWNPITYTIVFNGNGHSSGSTASMSMTYDTAKNLTANGFLKNCYTFTGWNTKADGSGTKYTDQQSVKNLTTVNGTAVTLYAQWKPITYSVKFNGNGSTSGSMSNQSFVYDTAQDLKANAFKREFTVTYNYNGSGESSTQAKAAAAFNGWAKTADGSVNYSDKQNVKNLTTVSGEVVNLYAKWADATVTLPQAVRTGYVFNGWYTTISGGTKIGDAGSRYTPEKNITLYAHWSPISYTVHFNGNGHTSGSMSDQSFTYDISKNLTANAFKREFTVVYDYNGNGQSNTSDKVSSDFNGWALTATGEKVYANKESVKNLSAVNGAVFNLFAKWTDKNVILPSPERTGYIFDGWYTQRNAGSKIGNGNDAYTPSADVTLYAKWTPITYTIVFNGNGSTSGSTASMIVKYDEEKNLNENRFVRTGYEFVQWNLKADGTDKNFADKQAVKNLTTENNAVITMYAQWKKIQRLSLEPITPNAAYREGTDVITSYTLINESSTPCVPDDNVSVVFKVYAYNELIATETASKVVVPGSDSNLLYFKWTVPADHGTGGVTITAEIVEQDDSYGLVSKTYQTCKYVIASTPDTQYEASAPDGFVRSDVPSESSDTASWSVWVYENGAFRKVNYAVAISDDKAAVTPDTSANAAFSNGLWTMKSGYGFGIEVNNAVKAVSGYTMPDTDAYTLPQYSIAKFPEFAFTTEPNKYRTLEIVSGKWVFRENEEYGRIHFTPLWYPDGEYTVTVLQQDCWTPAGMISRQVNSDKITISGSAYDDWYLC